jgi:transcriptional antiterminator/mannitol/fructose-specific phosphotransferase system IIA component
VDYQYLIQKYSVSERTLRNDLNEIDDYLKQIGSASLKRSKRDGISFEGDILQKDRLLWDVNNESRETYVMDQEERLDYLFFFLLQKEIPVSVQEIADDIGFSKNTVVEDVKKLSEVVSRHRCDLVKKRKIGMYLEITEFQRRQLYIELLQRKFNINKWDLSEGEINSSYPRFMNMIQKEWSGIFSQGCLKSHYKFIETLQNRLKRVYTDMSINTIALVMQLSSMRYSMGHLVSLQPYQLETIKLSNEYKILSQCYKMAPGDFLENEIERAYISMYLLTNKIFKQESVNFFDERVSDLKEIINRMITIMEQDQKVELLVSEREKLAKGLLLHLEPAVYRMRYGIGISNKLLSEIQLKFSKYYDAASKACMYLSQSLHVIVPDEEIGFITLHFGGIMEGYFNRQKIDHASNKVILVCNAGMATVRILEARLKDEFEGLNIVGYYSYASYLRQVNLEGDIVVSTISIDDSPLPTVVVNPLLEDRDIEKLNQYFRKKRHIQDKKDIDLKAIMNVVEKYCKVISPAHLKKELKSIIDPQIERTDLTLYEMLSKGRVKLNIEANTWEEAIDIVAEPLIVDGYITLDYKQAVKNSNRIFKAYSVIRPLVAIPHARPEDGVIDLGLSIVTLKEGINFGNPQNDPVRLVFMLTNKDELSHLRALNIFMQIIRREDHVAQLLAIKTYKEFETWIRKFEEGML